MLGGTEKLHNSKCSDLFQAMYQCINRVYLVLPGYDVFDGSICIWEHLFLNLQGKYLYDYLGNPFRKSTASETVDIFICHNELVLRVIKAALRPRSPLHFTSPST